MAAHDLEKHATEGPGGGCCVYFARRGNVLVILLCGGDKSWQGKDIKTAIAVAREV